MSKLLFTESQIKKYTKNKNVKKINQKTIQFTNEFKILIVKQVTLRDAVNEFEKIVLGNKQIGQKRIEQAYYRWKEQSEKIDNTNFLFGETRGRKKLNDNVDYQTLSLKEKLRYMENKSKNLEEENLILKKYMPLLEEKILKNKDVYNGIYEALNDGQKLNISSVSRNLNVKQSGYYKYIKTISNKKMKAKIDYDTIEIIKNIFYKRKSKYGYRRILMEINTLYPNLNINHKKIKRIMKEEKLIVKIRTINPYKGIAKATKEHKTFSNILNRKFRTGKPYEKILTDITYLIVSNKKYYLSAAKDCITGEIVAYNVRQDMKINLSLSILKDLKRKKLSNEILVHSDQGVHYTSPQYYKMLDKMGFVQSMSRRGNCIDNAPMESFFGHMKDEIEYNNCKSLSEIKKVVDDYMIYYNEQRKQWSKNKMTPIEYRNHLMAI